MTRKPAPSEAEVQRAILRVFVAGKLVNPLNARRHWRFVWKASRDRRAWTALAFVVTPGLHEWQAMPSAPKRVTFDANVGAEWDDDNLRAALKPHRDALVDVGIIDDDKPSAGHEFVYRQRIERTHLGVHITVQLARSLDDVRAVIR